MSKNTIVQTHTDAENPHFDIKTYPNWDLLYVDGNGFYLKKIFPYDALERIAFDDNCNITKLKIIKDDVDSNFETLQQYEGDKHYKSWITDWITNNSNQPNDSNKHDHIIKCMSKLSKLNCDYECYWTHNQKEYILTVIDSKIYLIRCDNQLVCSIYAPDYDLQMGDCITNVYILNGKHVVVHNHGDVCSIVIFKSIV